MNQYGGKRIFFCVLSDRSPVEYARESDFPFFLIYRTERENLPASKSLIYSSHGFVFVPSYTNSCKFLKPARILKQMDLNDENVYMSNLADKYFDRPKDTEFDICLADFALQ
jgi:hypothetical protein